MWIVPTLSCYYPNNIKSISISQRTHLHLSVLFLDTLKRTPKIEFTHVCTSWLGYWENMSTGGAKRCVCSELTDHFSERREPAGHLARFFGEIIIILLYFIKAHAYIKITKTIKRSSICSLSQFVVPSQLSLLNTLC